MGIKYGIIFIRKVHFWAIERFGYFDNNFSRQLIWRDFFIKPLNNAKIEKNESYYLR